MATKSDELIAKLTRIAHECGDEEVRAWIGRHLAETVRSRRGRRRRGLVVTLPQARGAKAILDEARVYELMEAR